MSSNARLATAIAIVVFAIAVALWAGEARESRAAHALDAALVAQAGDRPASPIRLSDLDALPEPVARYLRVALRDGQPSITLARFRQDGELRTDTRSSTWRPFTATHVVAPLAPGFIWDAQIQMAPLVHVRVRDSFVDGVGAGSVSLLSALPISGDRGGTVDEAELYRFLAEAPLYPTALVPRETLRWSPLDDRRAKATLTSGGITISLEFRFNDANEVAGIYAAARARSFGTEFIPTPWEGHWRQYVERDGMRVPSVGEVGWWIDGVLQLVWKGTIS